MKKILAVLFMVVVVFNPIPKHSQYSVPNALYDNGEIITPLDQNIWWYEDDDIPNNTVMTVVFDDNGTPNYIYDDIIIELVH